MAGTPSPRPSALAENHDPVIRQRLTAQLLAGPRPRDPLQVAERLLAIQAQDRRAALLAVRARSRGLTAAGVELLLGEERSLVITWLNRGTLHLVRSQDYFWLQPLNGPRLVPPALRRLANEGVSRAGAERGLRALRRALGSGGPLTLAVLGERLTAAGLPRSRSVWLSMLFLASARGMVVRGPLLGRQPGYVLVEDWLGGAPRVDPQAALAELAGRFLAGHGPATDRDLAQWSGLSLGQARVGLRQIAGELREGVGGLLQLRSASPAAPLPPPRLLGGFEPLLLGWSSRRPLLGEHQGLITVNGLFRSMLLVRGRAAGGWTLSSGVLRVRPFATLAPAVAASLEGETEDIARFLGLPRQRLQLEPGTPAGEIG